MTYCQHIVIVFGILVGNVTNGVETDWHFTGRNIAFHRTATQTPGTFRHYWHYYAAALAVDGNTDSDFNRGSCSCTTDRDYYYNRAASWTVDLGQSYNVTGIRIYNRNQLRDRLRGFYVTGNVQAIRRDITLYNDTEYNHYRDDVINITVAGHQAFTSIKITLPPHQGDPDNGRSYLTLCEVEIFAGSIPLCCTYPGAFIGGQYEQSEGIPSFFSSNDSFPCGTVLHGVCDTGYRLTQGTGGQTCTSPGHWTGTKPVCSRVTCPWPMAPSNGHYDKGSVHMVNGGTVIHAVCDTEYILTQGADGRTCTSPGYWTGTEPVCSRVTCPWPMAPSNGHYDKGSVHMVNGGTVIHAVCDTEYILTQGADGRTCTSPGYWTGTEPVCSRIICPWPLLLSSGHYDKGGVPVVNGGLPHGTVIHGVCDTEYILTQGADGRTCTSPGHWTGTEPVCSRITCPWPLALSGGYYDKRGFIAMNGRLPYGTIIHVKCNSTLYQLVGPETRVCAHTNQWNGTRPACVAVCQTPNITNGYYQGTSTINQTYKVGDVVSLVCNEGYKESIANTSYARCGENHRWRGLDVSCSPKQCEIKVIPGGFYNNTGYVDYNTYVSFTCRNGYKLANGSTIRRCLADTTLSGKDPVCQAIYCTTNVLNDTHNHYVIQNRSVGRIKYGQAIHAACEVGYEKKSGNKIRSCTEVETLEGEELVCTKTTSPEEQVGSAAIIGGSTGGIVILLIAVGAVGFVVFRRRRAPKSENQPHSRRYADIHTINNTDDEYEEIKETNIDTLAHDNTNKPLPTPSGTSLYDYAQQPDHAYYSFSDTKLPATAIRVEDLSTVVFTGDIAKKHYQKEFEGFPFGMKEKYTAAMKRENRIKNRYKNLYAYDDTRVVLNADKNKAESDYINASFIHGFGKTRAYVASQGATEDNINDIWRMVWQIDCGKIVMLTNLEEDNHIKCDQYWPTTGSASFGRVTVTLLKTEKFSDFIIRTLAIRLDDADERVVLQFHFTAWPDKSVPKYASSLVSFRNKVKYTASNGKGPVIVHCSAGIGRTGTFIAVDYLTDQAHALGYVDVPGCVKTLRRQRVNMVQTLDQYIFIHQTIVETLMLATSAIPSSRFVEAYKELQEVDPIKCQRKINVQFDLLKKMSPVAEEEQYVTAKTVRNRKKNRYSNTLPVEEFMPSLGSGCSEDYINAVFLPSYKEKRAFIITQTPMESTTGDFWKMVFEHNVHTIVRMCGYSEIQESDIYLPDEGNAMTYGDINVKHVSTEEWEKYTTLTLRITHDQKERTIKHILCEPWSDGASLPEEPSSILSLMEVVLAWQQQTGNHPVVVHCMNGAKKSGVFCVISAVIERLKIEQDVAISQVIEEMRNCREQIITTEEQFEFCHEAVCIFMEQFETYSNFTA